MQIPIKLRMTLVFAIGMALVFLALGVIGYHRVAADLLDSVDVGLRSRAQVLQTSIGDSSGPDAVAGSGKLIDSDEAFAQVLDASGNILATSTAVSSAPMLTAAEVHAISGPVFLTRQIEEITQYQQLDDPFRLLAVAMEQPPRQFVVVGATLSDVNESLQRLLVTMASLGSLAILLTTGAGWLLAGATLGPVEQMRKEAAAVSASEPARRLPVPRTGDELARLATTLNSMLDRLQQAIERERRFVDNASHELRTPIATLRAEIELALARKRDAPELEAALRSARDDVDLLQRLADDLLLLARMRGGRMPVRRVQARLSALTGSCRQLVDHQARDAGVAIEVETPDETVVVDPDRMQQALRNLLENAIRHTPRGGLVRLSVVRNDGTVRFNVLDSGPGFPTAMLDNVFDPFTRTQSDEGGPISTGLGLAIVRAIAEAHGGSAIARNTPHGASVTIELRA